MEQRVAVRIALPSSSIEERRAGKLRTKIKTFFFPKIGLRIGKTLLSVLVAAAGYELLLGGRNPCFACIGAVFGMGSFFREGVRHGGNRFVGTLLGGLVVIPFYWLYYNKPLEIPAYFFLIAGLFCVIYINLLFGANAAIQPATVIYFVVLFTVSPERYVSYTLARIVDTGLGVLVSLGINKLLPSPREEGKETQGQ